VRDIIRELTQTYGPSGNEEAVRAKISTMVADRADEVRSDSLGNLIVFRRGGGSGRKVMLAAHMDEIGLIATHIDDKGFIRFAGVGGVDPFISLGHRVVFGNGVTGVVGMEKMDKTKDLKLEKMFIDIGASSRAEAESAVRVGDMAVFEGKMEERGDRLVSKAMDDRVGCAVLVEIVRRIGPCPDDVYFVFTAQEEVGVRGATTSAFGIYPDVAIAVDVTRVGDTPKADTMDVSLGKGAAIKVKDQLLITHPGVKRFLVSVAESEGIPYQFEVLERGGTDAGAIHKTREGVPAGVVSIPTRYIHTPSEMVGMRDVEACAKLIERALERGVAL